MEAVVKRMACSKNNFLHVLPFKENCFYFLSFPKGSKGSCPSVSFAFVKDGCVVEFVPQHDVVELYKESTREEDNSSYYYDRVCCQDCSFGAVRNCNLHEKLRAGEMAALFSKLKWLWELNYGEVQ